MTKEEIAQAIEFMLKLYEQHIKRIKEDRDCAIKDNNLIAVWFNNGYLIGLKRAIEDFKQIIEILRNEDNIGDIWTGIKKW